jgi:hypothetical protein
LAATRRQSRGKDLPPSEKGAVYHTHNVQESPGSEKEMCRMNSVIVRDKAGGKTWQPLFNIISRLHKQEKETCFISLARGFSA